MFIRSGIGVSAGITAATVEGKRSKAVDHKRKKPKLHDSVESGTLVPEEEMVEQRENEAADNEEAENAPSDENTKGSLKEEVVSSWEEMLDLPELATQTAIAEAPGMGGVMNGEKKMTTGISSESKPVEEETASAFKKSKI